MRNLSCFERIRAVGISGLAAVFIAVVVPSTTSAATLGLNLLFPDVASGIIDVVYDAGSDNLSLTGISLQLDEAGGGFLDLDVLGVFAISVEIDSSGLLVANPGNQISVTGEIGAFTSGTLIDGDITAFGFVGDSSGMVLEFAFTVTGGDLATVGDFATFGVGGSIVGTGSNTFVNWNSSWNNLIFDIPSTGSATSDTAPTPEPSTALLLWGGIVALAVRSRRRQSRA